MSMSVYVTTEAVTWTRPVLTHLAASGVSVTKALKVTVTGAKVCRILGSFDWFHFRFVV